MLCYREEGGGGEFTTHVRGKMSLFVDDRCGLHEVMHNIATHRMS